MTGRGKGGEIQFKLVPYNAHGMQSYSDEDSFKTESQFMGADASLIEHPFNRAVIHSF